MLTGRRYALIATALIFLVWRLWGASLSSSGKLEIWFLNVGQGDAILLHTPDNYWALIDGGPGRAVLSELSAVMGQSRNLEFVMATHPDKDHIEGLISVLDYYQTPFVFFTKHQTLSPLYAEWLERVGNNSAKAVSLRESDDFMLGCCVQIDVLWPMEQTDSYHMLNTNDISTTILVKYYNWQVWLGGDLSAVYEDALLSKDMRADILKLGHHGSKTSTSAVLLDTLQPQLAIVSAGEQNSYGHPHAEVVGRLTERGIQIIGTNSGQRVGLKLSPTALYFQ